MFHNAKARLTGGVSGTVGADDEFQRVDRENACVGCGNGSCGGEVTHGAAADSSGERIGNGGVVYPASSDGGDAGLNRFSIVPHCIRRYLPVAVKTRSSHDVVLLCHDCRDKAQSATLARRRALLDAAGLDHHPIPPPVDSERRAVRSAANALAKHNALMAVKKKEQQQLEIRVAARAATGAVGGSPLFSSQAAPEEKPVTEAPPEVATRPTQKKKAKESGLPAARLAELLEALRAFLSKSSAEEVTEDDIARCQELDVLVRDIKEDGDSCNKTDDVDVIDRQATSKRPRILGEDGREEGRHRDMQPEAILLRQLGLAAPCFQGTADEWPRRAEVQAFVEGWRELFIDSVAPTHLPAGWKVDRPVWSS